MATPSKAVVADHAVGDEIARDRGQVVHRQIDAQRLDGNDGQACIVGQCRSGQFRSPPEPTPRPDDRAVGRQLRPRFAIGPLAGRAPPAGAGQYAVRSTCDQDRAIVEFDAECSPDGLPVSRHLGADEVPDATSQLGSVDLVTDPHLGEPFDPAITHQDQGVASHAVPAGMRASPIRVDRPPERDNRRRRDLVQHAAGAHLVERDTRELRGSHAADQTGYPGQTWKCGAILRAQLLCLPAHA